MGGGNSKSDDDDAKPSTDASTNASKSISETSSGFHLFELHMPTLGMGITTLIFIACLSLIAYMLYKRALRRRIRLHGHGRDHRRGRDYPMELGSCQPPPPPYMPPLYAPTMSYGSSLPVLIAPPTPCHHSASRHSSSPAPRFVEVTDEDPPDPRMAASQSASEPRVFATRSHPRSRSLGNTFE